MQKTIRPLLLTERQLAYLLVLLQSTSGNDLHREIQEKLEKFMFPKTH